MYRTPVIIGKISPDMTNWTSTRSRGILLALKGTKRLSLTAVIIVMGVRFDPRTAQTETSVGNSSIVYCPNRVVTFTAVTQE